MFRATFCPSSGAHLNCSRSLRFPYKSRGGCVSSRGLFVSGPWLGTHPPRLLYGNRRLRLQLKSAPDDGQNVAPKHAEQRLHDYTIRDFTTECASGWLVYLNVITHSITMIVGRNNSSDPLTLIIALKECHCYFTPCIENFLKTT
jgi:hypothetical protein